ncbi:MAG: hypothetical protein KDA93_11675 [Planctomycetaceae bacterium]|nr:hypothetical protein [Planctomycetaceae bacterium]
MRISQLSNVCCCHFVRGFGILCERCPQTGASSGWEAVRC